MDNELKLLLTEIREMLQVVTDGQDKLILSLKEIKDEQRKLQQEIRHINSVTANSQVRNEILN